MAAFVVVDPPISRGIDNDDEAGKSLLSNRGSARP